jgi:putative endonuclease
MGCARRPATARLGAAAEQLVARRLAKAGWTILGRNVRVGRGELDLVAIDPGPPRTLVVVEVRWRGRRDFGLPEESLDRRKRAALRHTISTLLAAGALPDGRRLPVLGSRLDLVAVDRDRCGEVNVRHHRGVRL